LLKPAPLDVQSADDRFLQKILTIVESHISDASFGVDPFSRDAGMSSAQLYRKLTSLTGYTPNDFIRHIRLQRAADLLDRKVGNVAEVAYQVGFNNLSYFAKCFKTKFKVSPSEFSRHQTQSHGTPL
jgi:AraC-like DNA-binding protein